MMLSTSATYTSGAAPVNAGASCHAATVSAEPRLDTRQPIRRSVVVTSTRGLHGISGSSCCHGPLARARPPRTAQFRERGVGFDRVRGDVVPGGDADCSAVITVTAAFCGPVDTVLANNACQELHARPFLFSRGCRARRQTTRGSILVGVRGLPD